jgi:hypothetical protein
MGGALSGKGFSEGRLVSFQGLHRPVVHEKFQCQELDEEECLSQGICGAKKVANNSLPKFGGPWGVFI